MSEQRKCKMQDSPPGSSCSGPGALAQQGYQRESGRGGVLGGRSAPSEVPAGLPVSTPTLGQGVLAPPAEPSTGPRSCSKTEAGCRALGVLPELLISWISGRLLGAVDTHPPPPGMPSGLQPQAAFPAPRAEPAGASASVQPLELGLGEAPKPHQPAGRQRPPTRVTKRSPRGGPRPPGETGCGRGRAQAPAQLSVAPVPMAPLGLRPADMLAEGWRLSPAKCGPRGHP